MQNIEPLISEDFQYIIDRHGLVVIGYAGRDQGVMNHFLKRKPYAYPFYWQYRDHPKENSEFNLFNTLIDKYKNEYKREIQLIKFDSASSFLTQINSGIEKLERVLIVQKNDQLQFEDYISRNDQKRIRALTLELYNRFSKSYDDHKANEDLDQFYKYKFEIFEKFVKDITFIFYYLDALLKFSLLEELKYFIDKIIKRSISIDWRSTNEFIGQSTPYYLLMNYGALFLYHDHPELIELLYDYEIRYDAENYYPLVEEISIGSEGWKSIGSGFYEENYKLTKYSVIKTKLLPPIISQNLFDRIDAFLAFDFILKGKSSPWICGSAMYYRSDEFQKTFSEYFGSKVDTKEKAIKFIKQLNERYKNFGSDFHLSIRYLTESLKRKFDIQQN